MSIYEKNGKFYCRFQIDGERHHYLCSGASSLKEARKIEDGFKYRTQQRQNGILPKGNGAKRVKMGILYDLYDKYSKVNKRTYNDDRYILKVLNMYFPRDKMSDKLKLSELEDFKIKIKNERGVGNAAINKYLKTLSKMFNLGIAEDYVTDNPVKNVKRLKEPNHKIRYLTKEEQVRLYEHLDGLLRDMVTCALHTGMRRGEIEGLKWSNIDFQYGFIELLETKSGRARKIPMSRTLEELFKSLPRGSDYVFPSPKTGGRYGNVKKRFHQAVVRAGIEDFRFHDLRHTAATRMVEKGIDLVTIKEILGHSCIETTMRYAHATPERKREAVEVLNSYI